MTRISGGPAIQKKTEPLGSATGWSALAKVVREIDEDKVWDCKEDIDTLLVFAGLFSAVMTAFIIESYKTLQQDPAMLTVQLLSQIASQAAVHRDTVNVEPAITALPFEPPLWAIRVNVLWFASLILSLTTASMGMLVKQWLREYLGGEFVGPRSRLRVRYFRHPGLTKWRVFEIIALLPILLQTSLGLFFVGLCFFTSSVHSSIGNTSLPLVAGWSAFVFTTTILPVISSRCPYKNPLSREYMKAIRPWGYSLLLRGEMVIQSARHVLTGWSGQVEDFSRRLELYRMSADEEENVVATDILDSDILGAVDAVLLDDDILEATILDSLRESQPSGYTTHKFLLEVIERRIPEEGKDLGMRLPIDLRPLTPRAWSAIMQLAIETLQQTVGEDDIQSVWQPWIGTTMLLLLSPYSPWHWSQISDRVSGIFEIAVARNRKEVCRTIASAQIFGQNTLRAEAVADQLIENFAFTLKASGDGELIFSCLEEIFGRRVFNMAYSSETFKLASFLDSPWRQHFTEGNLRSMAEFVAQMLQRQLDRGETEWQAWMADGVAFVVHAMSVMDVYGKDDQYVSAARTTLAQEFCSLLVRKESSQATLTSLLQVPPASFIGGNFIIDAIHALHLREGGAEKVLADFYDFTQAREFEDIGPMRLAFIAVRTIRIPDAYASLGQWARLFLAVSVALEARGGRYLDDNEVLAERCMEIVHALECNNADFSRFFFIPLAPEPSIPEDISYLPLDDNASYLSWRNSFNEAKSLFPDAFIYALSTIARKETRWYRIRRLKEIGYYVMSP